MKIVDLTGKKFERLTVISKAGLGPTGHREWKCMCDCGEEITVRGTSLTRGSTKSCGCYRADNGRGSFQTHGMYYHPSYSTWRSMMTRCHNANDESFKEYGAMGIIVCERWRDVRNFIEDMGERPAGMSIDRFPDQNGNYEPGNCRWATSKEQARNTRRNVRIEYKGERMTLAELAETQGVNYKALHYLIHTKKMTPEAAIKQLQG